MSGARAGSETLLPMLVGADGEVRRIFLRDFVIDCSIGVHAHEKRGPQKVAINIDLYLRPHESFDDDIARVLDYDLLRREIRAFVKRKGHINLQETLVEAIVEIAFANQEVIAVRASTEKRDAYEDSQGVGYEIFRLRPGVANEGG